MCTRFYIYEESTEYKEITKDVEKSPLRERFFARYSKPIATTGEIRPTDIVPVIAPDKSEKRAVFPMKWGFTLPKSNKPLVNARVETADSKPTFKDSWIRRRCIIPASWYYEWEHYKTVDGKDKTGEKYMIQPNGSDMTWLCGLYRIEDELPVFTVLTTVATNELSKIHDRMPLMMPKDMVDEWINPKISADTLLPYAVKDMIIEKR